MTFPRIQQTPPDEYHGRQAELCERAAEAYASELSTERDPVMRDRKATKAKHMKERAAFHRATAERLSKG